jgi:hypothetical protein
VLSFILPWKRGWPRVQVRSELFLTSVVVYINDVPHLMFRRAWFVGLQAWPDEVAWSLEITFSEGPPILAKYERRETWEAVLRELLRVDITAV